MPEKSIISINHVIVMMIADNAGLFSKKDLKLFIMLKFIMK